MHKGVIQIADVANAIIDPVLARRAGITTALLGSWEDIAGPDFATSSRPEKIAWARRADHEHDRGGTVPAVLTIACEGARALFLTHAQGELIARINAYFGYHAIGQIRIVQKPVSDGKPVRRRLRKLDGTEEIALKGQLEGIESDALKAALERLGRAVKASGQKKR